MSLDTQRLNLRLFDGEGAAPAAAEGQASAEQNSPAPGARESKRAKSPLADVKYGKTAEDPADAAQATEEPAPDREAAFEALIKGEYNDLFTKRVQGILSERLQKHQEDSERLQKLSPLVELNARRYGVDPGDLDALQKAVEADDSYWEEEAIRSGQTVEQVREQERMRRELERYRASEAEMLKRQEADRIYADWLNQSEQMKGRYPGFDLQQEITNQDFVDLLRRGIPVEHAYKLVHMDDLMGAAMAHTAQQVQQKTVNTIRARGQRPVENGAAGSPAALVKRDVKSLTRADRDEIAMRVAAGERISF